MNTLLKDRALLEISGEDRKKFLQGLITNNVNKASETTLIYAVMQNAQGRFLYDFFLFEIGEKLMVDCFAERRDEIMKKLSMYKLRSKVVIQKNDELSVVSNLENKGFPDPRHPNLGHRFYTKNPENSSENSTYHFRRISLKIPESEQDMTYEKSFILEFGFDEFNAIDYQKGCYVGQELTARTHYRGEIRKKICHLKIKGDAPEKNSEITCEGKSTGIFLSSILHEGELHALALIKLPDDHNFVTLKEKIESENPKILIVD